ncbi:MAG: CRISPR-associated endonuclease Cas2 [Elusimicrobiota bacterium]|jgi:CRISPR-associated protein Cas2|nr:CRISPR-associated endonuclease Cas2 [Elusimicrobiota bacterium]
MGWLLVLFDLPTDTKTERREATRFRNSLLDLGYLMVQYSVYARCAITLEKKATHLKQLKTIAPATGNVQCIFITDAQWEKSITISCTEVKAKRQITKEVKVGEQLQFW